ncbi:MAG: hypothetical protein AMK70_03645 [Nitrospira bacterium SG8_35_1]|nr:MAG: hypothetical protein AMK70_03645 [Nitrospira bacterium SG8_35_1]
MGKGSKKLYWAGAGAAFLFVLLLAVAFIVPRVVDSVWLKKTIQAEVAKQIDGDLDFQKAELVILPHPAVSLKQITLAVPDKVKVSLDTLKVYPKLFPLLTGNLVISEAAIATPDFSWQLPEKVEVKPDQEKTFSFSEVLENASSELAAILTAIPGLELKLHNGTLRLYAGDEQVFLFENINGTLAVNTKSLTTTISCSSNFWDTMELRATLVPDSKEGKGKISLENINGKVLADYFLEERFSFLGGAFSSLETDFSVSHENGLIVDIKSSETSFNVFHEDKKITAIVENLTAKIQYSDQSSSIAVDDLTLSYPQVQLSGSFTYDRSIPHASLDITSQNANITGLYEALPVFIKALYGDQPVVREIFDITRGGIVTGASFHIEGKSLAGLAVFESMHIEGQVKGGKILLSDLGLDLQEVTGDVAISQGILEGRNLQARLGNSTGFGGSLKLGLVQKETTPFYLDLGLNADISEIPPLLKKLVPQKQVLESLSLIETIEGTTQGRLTLGNSLESLAARAEADNITAHVKYKPIPFPVTLDGGRIIYDGMNAESHGLKGKVGRSTFANYSSRLNFEDEPTIEVQSGTFQIVLDEIYPWLATSKRLEDDLKNIKNLTGTAEVTVKNIKGPLLQPAKLQYDFHGALKNIILTTTTLPGILNIKSGQTIISPDKFTFEDLQADLLDSSLTYSGVLQGFLSGKTKAEVIVTDAEIGAEVNTWLVEEFKMPEQYQFRTPLLISRANAKWARDELFDLQGDFSIKNGPIFLVDIMFNPDELVLRNLAIKNGEDQAFIKLDLKKRKIGAEFQGSLLQKTIGNILLYKETFPDAWIKGDIRFHIDKDSFADTTATGKLEGGNFSIPLKPDKHLLLNSYLISASGKTINLSSSEAAFGGNNFSISGDASLSQGRLSMNFDVKTDTIELDKILEELQDERQKNLIEEEEEEKTNEKTEGEAEEGKKGGKSLDFVFDTTINLHADSLLYNGYTWRPFESQITFANSFLGFEVLQAELCHLSTPGKLSFHEGKIYLDFKMEANGQELKDVLVCLEGGEQQMTGNLNLKANITGYGSPDTLVNSLQGDLLYSAKEGFIYKDARAAKLLYFLNVTNMFRGKIPDLATKGFHYDSLVVKGTMKNGVLLISPAKLDAPIMEIAAHGTIDIPKKKVDLLVLVAPLQTINKIQKMLPIISKIIPSNLAALPVEAAGDFSDIKVRTVSMSAISRSVFGTMVDALSAPVRVLEDNPDQAQ